MKPDRVPAEDSLLDEPTKGLAEGGPVGGDGEIEGGHGEGFTTRWAGSHWQSCGWGRVERGQKEIFEGTIVVLESTRFRFPPYVSTIFGKRTRYN